MPINFRWNTVSEDWERVMTQDNCIGYYRPRRCGGFCKPDIGGDMSRAGKGKSDGG
ncbi:MAG: hypothetical protein ACFB14_27900 [Leptolyngbyaceae cyanobacterium]